VFDKLIKKFDLFLCAIGMHEPSEFKNEVESGKCPVCGKKLVKDSQGNWRD